MSARAEWRAGTLPALFIVADQHRPAVPTCTCYLFAPGCALSADERQALAKALLARHQGQADQPGWLGILGCDEPLLEVSLPAYFSAAGQVTGGKRLEEAFARILENVRRCGGWWDISAARITKIWAQYPGYALAVHLFVPDRARPPLDWDCATLADWRERVQRMALPEPEQAVRLLLVAPTGEPFAAGCDGPVQLEAFALADLTGHVGDTGISCQRLTIGLEHADHGELARRLRLTPAAEAKGWELETDDSGTRLVNYAPNRLGEHLDLALATWQPAAGDQPSASAPGWPKLEVYSA
jgi:hypothetical protein